MPSPVLHLLTGASKKKTTDELNRHGERKNESLLWPYLYPNSASLTTVHGGSITAVRHDTCQLSGGVSVAIVDLVCVGADEVGIL